ncbi:MAG: CoA-binding protein [Acidobacteria bacterium]|nr:MAG: CoA-binding protein [Acidobacteriota bacterium]
MKCPIGRYIVTTIHDVENFLALHRIAMVGVSRNPKDFSRLLFREMCDRGYDMVPINLGADEIDERECFHSLQAVKEPVEGVLVMTPFHATLQVVQDCAAAGVRKVWIYRAGGKGAVSPEAIAFCKGNGIRVVDGHCPFMFFPETKFVHRVHGLLQKITRRYPAAA